MGQPSGRVTLVWVWSCDESGGRGDGGAVGRGFDRGPALVRPIEDGGEIGAGVVGEIQAGEHCHFRQARTSENGRNAPFVAVQAMLGQIRVSGSAGRVGLLAVVRRVGG